MSTNGNHPETRAPTATEVVELLRDRRRSRLVFRGFGTLVVGVVLFVLMLLMAPSVAPEHIVDRPVATVASTTTTP